MKDMNTHTHLKIAAVIMFILLAVTPAFNTCIAFGNSEKEETLVKLKPDAVAYSEETKTREFLLRFKPGVSAGEAQEVKKAHGLRQVDEIPQIRVLVMKVPATAAEKVKAALQRNPLVDFIEENLWIQAAAVPNDPYYSSSWHLSKISATAAWDVPRSSNVIVAVLDSGVDSSHPDLVGRLLPGYNFYDNNGDTSDVYGHGTKVAGVAAATTDNGAGVSSISWGAYILPIRVTDTNGYTSFSLLSKGLIYAADNGARAAVMSFLIYNGQSLSSAAKYMVDKGGVVVGAGGNTGSYADYADNPYIISVSATTSSDSIASFSTYGPYIDLSAPGVGVYSTIRGGTYGSVSGTSFSAPLTAGLAALMLSANPSLSPAQVEQILKSTTVDLGQPGYDEYYGWGRIDAYAAVKQATDGSLPVDTSPPKVSIAEPTEGAVVKGVVSVRASAEDNVGVTKVELYRNDVLFAIDLNSPFEFAWDTTLEANGKHSSYAKAYDAAGNQAQSGAITVTVDNPIKDTTPPSVSILKPTADSSLSGVVSVTVDAVDDVAVARVELYRDGVLLASATVPPYVFQWNTAADPDGAHTLYARAYDTSGNKADSNTVVVNTRNEPVDSTPPTVRIVSPTEGSRVTSSVDVVVSVNDDFGIAKVEFYIDGKLKFTAGSKPYTWRWNTRGYVKGPHVIKVVAYDVSGLSAEASVTVNITAKK